MDNLENIHKIISTYLSTRKKYGLRNFPYLFWDHQPYNIINCKSIISEISEILKIPASIVIDNLRKTKLLNITDKTLLMDYCSSIKIDYIVSQITPDKTCSTSN